MIRRALATAGMMLVSLSAASAAAQTTGETITISRAPRGLHQLSDPYFDMTLWPDGRVVLRTPGGSGPAENGDSFQISPVEAARFRAALLAHKPAVAGMTTFCRGRLGPDHIVMFRVPVFGIFWNGPAFAGGVTACDPARVVRSIDPDGVERLCDSSRTCDGSDERAIVEAIEAALRAIHFGLDGHLQ